MAKKTIVTVVVNGAPYEAKVYKKQSLKTLWKKP
jgi:hypothetical protein